MTSSPVENKWHAHGLRFAKCPTYTLFIFKFGSNRTAETRYMKKWGYCKKKIKKNTTVVKNNWHARGRRFVKWSPNQASLVSAIASKGVFPYWKTTSSLVKNKWHACGRRFVKWSQSGGSRVSKCFLKGLSLLEDKTFAKSSPHNGPRVSKCLPKVSIPHNHPPLLPSARGRSYRICVNRAGRATCIPKMGHLETTPTLSVIHSDSQTYMVLNNAGKERLAFLKWGIWRLRPLCQWFIRTVKLTWCCARSAEKRREVKTLLFLLMTLTIALARQPREKQRTQ
jgi:hypothetical protein